MLSSKRVLRLLFFCIAIALIVTTALYFRSFVSILYPSTVNLEPHTTQHTNHTIEERTDDHPLNTTKQKKRKKKKKKKYAKDGYRYCNLSEIKERGEMNRSASLNTNQLKIERLRKPPPCDPNRAKQTVTDDDDNFVPFVNRCNVKSYTAQSDIFEYYGARDSRMSFLHVYKAGGTSVFNTWHNLSQTIGYPPEAIPFWMRKWKTLHKKPTFEAWVRNKTYFYQQYLSKQYLFSFVRDPVSRFLSSFFEYEIRQEDHVQKIYGMQDNAQKVEFKHLRLLRELIVILKHRLQCELYENSQINTAYVYWDRHLLPQLSFLLNDEWKFYPFDFIGSVQNISSHLFKIFKSFYEGNASFDDIYDSAYNHARSRKSSPYVYNYLHGRSHNFTAEQIKNELILDVNDIAFDEDIIQSICELYWLDYICLPFQIPKQCNLTELFLKHYPIDVEYNQCYS